MNFGLRRATAAGVLSVSAFLGAGAVPGLAAPTPDPSPASRNVPEYITVVSYDPVTGKLAYVKVTAAKERTEVDVSDMRVDTACAFGWFYGTDQNVRISMLDSGCAHLLPGKGTAAEREAERKRAGASPSPSAGSASGPTVPGLFAALGRWLVANWLEVLGILIGIAGLIWFVRAIYSRKVRVLLAGPPSVGKTDLWLALRDGNAIASNSRPSPRRSAPVELDQIEFGKYILYPSVTDTAGAKAEEVLDELEGYRRLRWKRKLVLVVVAAPVTGNDAAARPVPFDDKFIGEQKGYMSLPRAIIGSRDDRRRPDLVVFFISKFDLIFGEKPADSTASAARRQIEDAFRSHMTILEAVCKAKKVTFKTVIGSSKFGWGVDEVEKSLRSVIRK